MPFDNCPANCRSQFAVSLCDFSEYIACDKQNESEFLGQQFCLCGLARALRSKNDQISSGPLRVSVSLCPCGSCHFHKSPPFRGFDARLPSASNLVRG